MMPISKLSKFRTTVTAFATALVTTACTTPYTPDFSSMSATYANILEQYQLNSILSNIIRAAGERPLSFLDIPSINGTGNVSNNAGLNASLSGLTGGVPGGPLGLTSLAPNWSMSIGNSFQFTQSSLDNATFLRGFLSQIPIETAKYFISDNLPKELVFSLVVEQIQIKQPDGKITVYRNNPLLPEHKEFQKIVYVLLDQGLSIRQVPNTPPQFAGIPPTKQKGSKTPQFSGREAMPPMSNTMGPPEPNIGSYNQSYYGAANQTFYGNSAYNSYGYTPPNMNNGPKYKICLDVGNYSDFKQLEYAPGVYCHVNELYVNESKAHKPELLLVVRSPNNVFEYLGQVVTAQNSDTPYMVTVPPSKTTPPRKIGQNNQYALLVVNENQTLGKTFAKITNLDGNVYSIPATNNGYSPIVIKFISQLLSLNKIPGSIPPSPAILLQ